MSTVRADDLLKSWSLRLRIHADESLRWSPDMQASIETLVGRLRDIAPDEAVEIDADELRDPIAKFVRVTTGEVLAEIYQPLSFFERP